MNYSKVLAVAVLTVLAIGAVSLPGGYNQEEKQSEKPKWHSQVENKTPEKATFAGGCFWCIEAIFDEKKGVKEAISGYAGGKNSTATYDQVSTGKTDHREAVRVLYYPSIVSYEDLLDTYWKNIDPTDAGGQFTDRGPQYTTAIYYHNEKQKQLAERSKKNLSNSGRFNEPIVTEIEEFTTFFRAEEYHQNYSDKRTMRYKAYKKASGREGFFKKFWSGLNE